MRKVILIGLLAALLVTVACQGSFVITGTIVDARVRGFSVRTPAGRIYTYDISGGVCSILTVKPAQ